MTSPPDQIPTSALIGGNSQPNPFFSTGNPASVGRPYIIGDPTMSGPHQPGFGRGGVSGNLIGPNSGIFNGGGGFGGMQPPAGMGVNPLMGGQPGVIGGGPGMMGPMGPDGMIFHQPMDVNDLDP